MLRPSVKPTDAQYSTFGPTIGVASSCQKSLSFEWILTWKRVITGGYGLPQPLPAGGTFGSGVAVGVGVGVATGVGTTVGVDAPPQPARPARPAAVASTATSRDGRKSAFIVNSGNNAPTAPGSSQGDPERP